jgi:NADH-quinone oxidoreductase subunit H
MLYQTFIIILKILIFIIPCLIGVAYFTLIERKAMGSIQRRRGPNVVGYMGLLQPLADGLKLFVKESVCPSSANTILFFFAPILAFVLSMLGWGVIPFNKHGVLADTNLGLLYIFAISCLSVCAIVISGWSSNSKYAFLGGLRSAAQMISYEVSMGFVIVTLICCVGSYNLTDIILAQEDVWFCLPFLPLGLIFFVSALAETNRHPFDLSEAEAELVSGYNVEYSGVGFTLFFLGEYLSMLLMSTLTSILFLGGWLSPMGLFPILPWMGFKICIFVFLFVLCRAALPRFRYDQLMLLGWKAFLPFSLSWLLLTAGICSAWNYYL